MHPWRECGPHEVAFPSPASQGSPALWPRLSRGDMGRRKEDASAPSLGKLKQLGLLPGSGCARKRGGRTQPISMLSWPYCMPLTCLCLLPLNQG